MQVYFTTLGPAYRGFELLVEPVPIDAQQLKILLRFLELLLQFQGIRIFRIKLFAPAIGAGCSHIVAHHLDILLEGIYDFVLGC